MPPIARRTVLGGASALIAAAASPATNLRFLFSQPLDAFDPVIAEFEKRNPDILIQKQQVPFDQLAAQIQSRLGSGDSSLDVFGADEPRIPAFAHREFLHDLSPLRADLAAQVDPRSVEAVSAEGKIWALPLWTSTQLLFYNKDLLAKASLPTPSGDPKQRMTWETLKIGRAHV